MKKEEIHLWDVKRILFGQAPPEFLLEIFIRTLVVYVLAVIAVRLMGKRMNGQHTIIELSVMVMMGAIISLPMQTPDKGIVQGLLVLLITLLLLRGTNWLSFKNSRFERTIQGREFTLVKDGVLQKDIQSSISITNQQIFEVLRSKKIYNLAKVKRMYLEACGIFSIYQEQKEKPGLPIYPQIDETIYKHFDRVSPHEKACINCGLIQPETAASCCNCHQEKWAKAIL